MSSAKGTGTFKFKAEIRQLLDILVHSLYASKEIFLRELVSNASDALDKLRIEQLRGAGAAEMPLEIRITTDKDAGVLTISDTGVGMTRDEIVQNIGTIAHSGTSEFVKRLAETKDSTQASSVIGQFGVGFYSVFMVADKVELTTRSHTGEEPAWTWTSDGQGSFTISPAENGPERGTSIRVTLRPEAKEYANPARIKEIIARHSNFLAWPILVDGERVNTVQAIWREPKFQVTAEQYAEFYKFLTYDSEEPLDTVHIAADAPIQWTALLFVPQKNRDLLMGSYQGQQGVDLYVRRVLIQHENKDVLPEYLGFMRGVVDSEDLPLNVARETLQENLLLRKISTSVVKQVLSHLKKLAESEPAKYATLWREHGKIFKLGYGDFANKESFAELLRFASTASDDPEALTSLAEYAGRMKEGQKEIYFISGQSREAALANPNLELLRRKGVEVLLLLDPIDEFVMETLHEFDSKLLVPAERADPAVLEALPDVAGPDGEEKQEELREDELLALPELISRMKAVLGERVTEVRESKRLKDSPVVLVAPDGQPSSGMQKIIRLMTKDESVPPRVLEINTHHPVIRNLLAVAARNAEDPFLALAAEQLYESAMIQDGYLADPHTLVRHMRELLGKASELYAK
ncbi:Chaperone protein htpG [Desulfovibrio sp. X2]|uniref:molecular chaperone HtpG n=1 Tax=Desulfovibrio sp. X2 TaxID=941449 RepID=UPI000358D8DB|nr:molecular chaperone HtpG [Desulfovibrio sp. X2]EPR43081.1 Chaperone protein htpG [Desulfovibrio sp. X2]